MTLRANELVELNLSLEELALGLAESARKLAAADPHVGNCSWHFGRSCDCSIYDVRKNLDRQLRQLEAITK